ncbi:MAG: LysM peptidoglycan-binding domain-containing protein, partial [Gammaproteobacteria bacterium]|nr:LysM peptidoglycan-binding domain-containing protein [Gammaproteobacteria bacterium]
NHLRGNTIRAGNSLTIPVATKSLAFYNKSNDQRLKHVKSTARKGTKHTHTVRSGDTIWDISRKYNVSSRRLAKWNGMAPRDTLKIGQKLVVWSGSNKASTRKTSWSPAASNDATNRKITYRVRSGDSLSRIASKFRVSIPQLRSWNSLPKGKFLQPGQYLKLFIDVTKQSS